MSGSEFHLRETEPGDVAGLNELYYRIAGIQRSEAQWQWEWRDGPWGAAPSWVVVETAGNRVVGHHGVVPQRLLLPDGRVVTACRTENTMVDPDFRKRFLYVAYEARLLQTILQRFDLVMTTAGKGAQAVLRKRLGYRAVGRWRTVPLYGHPLYRLASHLPGGILEWLPGRAGVSGWDIEVSEDLARIATLCALAPVPAVTVERSAAFLRWRFVDHPYHRYQLAILRQNGRDAGYIAWKRQARSAAADLVIDDMVMLSAEADHYRQALGAFVAAQRGAVRLVLRSLDTGGPLSQVMVQAVPAVFAAQNATELLVRWRDDAPGMDWDVTPAVSQGI